jgi:hypothetical protein
VDFDTPIQKRRGVLDLLPELTTLDGKSWGCGLGGTGYLVEGAVNEKHFAFLTANPGSCVASESRLAIRLIDAVMDLRHGFDDP